MKINRIMALLSASMLAFSAAGCGGKSSDSTDSSSETVTGGTEVTSSSGDTTVSSENTTEKATEAETTEPITKHVSPVESISAECATQVTPKTVIQQTEGSNTLNIPLADLIEDGDEITSFTFVIYSGDNTNIGSFKGGCGIAVSEDCPGTKSKGWYQTPDFTAPTQGTYGEIKWDVPQEIRSYISANGEVMFGYWYGGASSVEVSEVICTYNRKREIPVDGTVTIDVGKSCAQGEEISVPTAGHLPENAIPEAVVYKVSSSGGFKKYTGAFGYKSSAGSYQSGDTAVFTSASSLDLTWFVPDDAKSYISEDGEIVLGYWWSEQSSVTLDSVTVKYSQGDGSLPQNSGEKIPEPTKAEDYVSENGFRSAAQIAQDINVGWNLGNTLESYGYNTWTKSAETAWGNPVTSKDMIRSVKEAGFNAIRIPVTWGEHMTGNDIDEEWLNRVKEVVDYAYDQDMFVILNMHHDDYLWFTPSEAEYDSDSNKLIAVWKQISEKFKDYDDRLLFEGMNEPRTVESEKEWLGGTPEERKVINEYEKDFVSTVRASGGKNAERTLIVTSYAASAETVALNDVVIPNAGNIILSVHYYAPWEFSEGTKTTFSDAEKKQLDGKFKELNDKFVSKGVPVIIGEFGCVAVADNSVRAQYYNYYISAAKKYGIKCFIWDNGVATGKSSYGIFDRKTFGWNDAILSAVKEAAK